MRQNQAGLGAKRQADFHIVAVFAQPLEKVKLAKQRSFFLL
jgi:hypothetical protein